FVGHVLEGLLQALWIKTKTSPLEDRYFSCVPYLLGGEQAMQYSFRSRLGSRTQVPGLPFSRPPDNYLRDAMVATLARQDVEFDIRLQSADVQPLALAARAPPAGQHQPCTKADVLGAVSATAADEQRGPLRAHWRRGLPG